MDATDLDHIDWERPRRFSDGMCVDENHRRFVPDIGYVVPFGIAVNHSGVGQPRHELDVHEQRQVGQSLLERLRDAAIEHQVWHIGRIRLRTKEHDLSRRGYGKWDRIDFWHMQSIG